MKTWGNGNVRHENWKHGDMESGDMESGNMETWRHGNVETPKRGDT